MASLSEKDVRALLDRPAGRRSAMLLAGCGFAVPRRAAQALAELASGVGNRDWLVGALPGFLDDVSGSSDPDAALDALGRLVVAAGGDGEGLLCRLHRNAERRRILMQLLSSSRSFSSTLVRYPEWVEEVLDPGEIDSAHCRDALRVELHKELSRSDSRPDRLAVLRRFRRRHTLGIAARDMAGRSDLAGTTGEISAVADAVVAGALEAARAESGKAVARLVVLALGKLGGEELNYSSDIDLIFIADSADRGVLALAEELVRQLSEPTAEGVAYRVDMRLRPEGSSGALVWELGAALAYYRDRARPWERQALIKCRPVAGDEELGREFMSGVESFVWQRGVTPAQVARACQLRSEMERAAGGEGQAIEVKSGTGGIRDVEFAVQILQLAHGAEHPEVRRTGTLKALEALKACGLVESGDARSLRSGYEFLRRVEHCLQTMDELAMHAVPTEAGARAALARRLGYGGSPESAREDFEGDLARHAATLRPIYERICGQGASGEDLAGKLEKLLAGSGETESELVSLLSLLGFGGGRRAAKAVRSLAARPGFGAPLLAAMLERLRAGPSPDRGLANLDSVADGSALERMADDQELRETLLTVAERSDFLVGLLASHRECLDLLVAGENGRARRGRGRLAQDFADSTADARGDQLASKMGVFRKRELVRVGARDLLDGEPAEDVSSELCYLAELMLCRALAACGVAGEVAVLALGRLGGHEMSYGSDLDLIFVDTGAEEDQSSGVQEATRLLAAAGYDVDTRLRPGGGSGPLVASLSGYVSYRDRGELAVWERLALARARTVGGSDAARGAATAFLEETLFSADPPADLAEQAWSMRLRLERTAGEDDFKRGPGGLVDLEFLSEYLALAHGPARPELRWLGTEATFSKAAELGVLPPAEAEKAVEAHSFLRRLELRARVVVGRPVRALPAEPGELARLARMMELGGGGEDPSAVLRAEFERHTSAARRLLERVIGG